MAVYLFCYSRVLPFQESMGHLGCSEVDSNYALLAK